MYTERVMMINRHSDVIYLGQKAATFFGSELNSRVLLSTPRHMTSSGHMPLRCQNFVLSLCFFRAYSGKPAM